MKKYVYTILGTSLVLFGAFCTPHFSLAEVIIDNTGMIGTSTFINPVGGNDWMYVGTSTAGSTGVPLYFEFYDAEQGSDACNAGTWHAQTYTLYDGSVPPTTGSSNVPSPNYILSINTPCVVSSTPYLATGTITTTINSGDNYFLAVANNSTNVQIGGTMGTWNSIGSGVRSYNGGMAWYCLTTDSNFADCGFVPPQQPALTLAFPGNGATVPNFSNWVLTLSNLTASSSIGSVSVTYGTNSSSLNFADTKIVNSSYATSTVPIVIPKTQFLNLTTSTTIYYQDFFSLNNVENVAGDSGSFVINPTIAVTLNSTQFDGTSSFNSSTYPLAGPFYQYSPSSALPGASGSAVNACQNLDQSTGTFSWFGNGLLWFGCQFVQIMITPSPGAQAYMHNSITAFEGAPPFSGVFSTYNNLTGAVSSTPTSQDLTYTLNLGDGTYVSSTYPVPFLNSSTMSTAITPDGKTLLFNLEDAMFDLLVLGLIFYTPWHWWRRKQHQTKSQ